MLKKMLLWSTVLFCILAGSAVFLAFQIERNERATAEYPVVVEWEALNDETVSLVAQGRYREALPLALEVNELAIASPEVGIQRLALSYGNLADAYTWLGDLQNGEKYYLQAIELVEDIPEYRVERYAWWSRSLGSLYEKQARFDVAMVLTKRAQAIWEEDLEPGHAYHELAQNSIALIYYSQGNLVLAEEHYRKTLSLQEVFPEKGLPEFSLERQADALSSLGLILTEQEKFLEAEEMYSKALSLKTETYGAEHPMIAGILNNIGLLELKRGEYAEARDSFSRVLDIERKAYGSEHQTFALTLQNIGVARMELGNHDAALEVLDQSLSMTTKLLGPDHIATGAVLNNLGALHLRMGNYVKSQKNYEGSLVIKETILGADNVVTLLGLSSAMIQQKQYEAADPVIRLALKLCEKYYGLEHSFTAKLLGNLGYLYRELGDATKSVEFYLRAVEAHESVSGVEHPDYAMALSNLGYAYMNLGENTKSEELFLRAIEIQERTIGSNHPDVAVVLNNLAVLYSQQDRDIKAEPLLRRALRIEESALGHDHPQTQITRKNLIGLYRDLGLDEDADILEREIGVVE